MRFLLRCLTVGAENEWCIISSKGSSDRCPTVGALVSGLFSFTETKKSSHKPPNTISIAQKPFQCLFSFCQKFIPFSYETSHLENSSIRMYYEDTKKE